MPDTTRKSRRALFLLCAALSALASTPAIAAPPPGDAALERMRADLVRMGEGSVEPKAYVTAARAYEAACARRWTEADWQLARCRTQVVDALLNDAQANEAIALLRKIIPQLEAGGAKAEAALATAQSDLAGVLPVGEADAEADKLFATALATRLRLHGEASAEVVDTLIESANRLVQRGKYTDAEALVLRADEAASGMDLPPGLRLELYSMLGKVNTNTGRYAVAEEWLNRGMAFMASHLTPNDPRQHVIMTPMMMVYYNTDRLDKAEELARRMLDVWEKNYGTQDYRVGVGLYTLAQFLPKAEVQQAEGLYRRALPIYEARYGKESNDYVDVLGSLGGILIWQGKLDEAEALILETIAIDAKLLDPNHPNNAIDYQALLEIERKRGNLDKALAYGRKALDIRLASLGERNAQTIESWRLVGELLMAQGRWQEARSPLEHSRDLAVAVYNGTGEIVAISEGLLALTYSQLGDQSAAMASARAAIAASVNKRRVMQRDNSLARALEATAVAVARQPVQDDEALALAFRAMQVVANSSTGAQAVEASARTAARSPAIEALARRQQDLDRQVSAADRRLSALRAKGTDAEIVAARATLEASRAALDAARREMNEAFPRYGDLANQSIAPLADLQGQAGALRPGEALVQLMQTRDALYAMVVTPRKASLHTLALGSEQAAALVGRVRKGLSLEGAVVASDIPRFDLAASHELYRKVVAPLRRDIGKDALLYVSAEGPLASLPLAVLATRPAGGKNPGFADYRRSRFLADELRLATVPSVGALASARRVARPVKARRPLLAIADPALSGDTRVTTLAQFARLRGSGGRNAATVCRLRPLPDTRIEADRLQAALGGGASAELLGSDASERKLASLNGEGALADYRVILFATHGLVAGEASSSVEPSLVLTPDAGCEGTAPEGDGLLTASEITALNLDADWVVLSGCNTASPEGLPNAAPLTGLVRSFLYAGARRMLVSHWSVDSAATADLVAGTFAGKGGANAASLQQAMVTMRKSTANGGIRAHPAFWGAFVAVGAEP